MRYTRPVLHSLSQRASVEGNCADGSAAAADLTCTVGGDPGSVDCYSGYAAGLYCHSGVAATETGPGACLAGAGTGTGCSTGNAPVG